MQKPQAASPSKGYTIRKQPGTRRERLKDEAARIADEHRRRKADFMRRETLRRKQRKG